MLHQLSVDSHRRSYYRLATSHVLYELVSTFAELPRRIDERHDADIQGLKVVCFGALGPRAHLRRGVDDWYAGRTNQNDSCVQVAISHVQRISDQTQIVLRLRSTNPPDSKPVG